MKSDLFDLCVSLVHQTDKAYLVTVDDEKKVWLPKAACELEPNKDGTYTLTAKASLLQEKGLI